MDSTYAQIKDGKIYNIIILKENIDKTPWSVGFDSLIRIDNLEKIPYMGDSYDGQKFDKAPPIPLNKQYTQKEYGQLLLDEFDAMTAERKLSSDELFKLVQNASPVYILLEAGSLQTFFDLLDSIPVDGTLITKDIIENFRTKLQDYLLGN